MHSQYFKSDSPDDTTGMAKSEKERIKVEKKGGNIEVGDSTGAKTIADHRAETLSALEGFQIDTAETASKRLNAIEQIMRAEAEDAAARDAKANETRNKAEAKQYIHYRSVMTFMAVAVAYLAWAIMTFVAQIWIANRIWVKRATRKDKDWTIWKVYRAWPTVFALLFAFMLAKALIQIDFETSFALPGVLDDQSFPVPVFWIAVGTMTSTLIFVTALTTRRLAEDFPSPARAHAVKVGLANLVVKMEEEASKARQKLKAEGKLGAEGEPKWPEKVSELDVLILGCSDKTTGDAAVDKPIQNDAKLPKVSREASAKGNFAAVKSLCIALIAVMIATLVLVSLGFDVLEGELKAEGALRDAIVASGDAWIMVLGVGMSVSVFLIYTTAASRLLPYIATEEKKADKPAKSWSLKGKASLTSPLADTVQLEAEPVKEDKKPPLVDRDLAYVLGGYQPKLESILEGAAYGGGFQAVFDEEMFKRLASLVGLLAPAVAGALLTVF